MSKVYTIAFVPLDSEGHLTSMTILAQTLRDFGHKCVFVINETMKQKFADKGLDCVYYTLDKRFVGSVLATLPAQILKKIFQLSSLEKCQITSSHFNVEKSNYCDNEYKRLIDDLKPDAIVVDILIYSPAVVCAGIPWVTMISSNALKYYRDVNLPPGKSGFSINSDKRLWDEFRRETEKAIEVSCRELSAWLVSKGAPPVNHRGKLFNSSPYLNLYLCPEELDYKEMAVKDKTFVSFDPMIGYNIDNESKGFEIPKKLSQRSGKLIYISMGSICSKEVNLMKRLVSLLSNSKHRFIVSKGELGQEYELPDNMWGQNWLPQLQVLPIVDLVLTHGGNNTVNECLYFAKPMIVFPLFGDGYDNAQRIMDKELGVRLNPYVCTQTELFEALDSLLNDSQLNAKYENISQRMKNSKSSQKCAKLIEDLITSYVDFN